MTLTFPRDMPDTGVGQQEFEPLRVDYSTGTAGGRSYSVAAGPPRWRADWVLGQSISPEVSDAWRAFVASLNGSQRAFFGRDVERPYPRLYPQGFSGLSRAGGGAFDGVATSWSHSVGGDGQGLLTLNGLPAGFQLSLGDYVGFRWTTSSQPRRALVRLLEAATADGSGVIAAASVTPAVPTVVPGGAEAYLDRPECVMRLNMRETSLGAMGRRRVVSGRIVALQEVLP